MRERGKGKGGMGYEERRRANRLIISFFMYLFLLS